MACKVERTSPPSDTRDDAIALRISHLMQRLRFNEKLDAEQGLKWGRTNESDAIAWALDEFRLLYPEETDEAERLLEERYRRFLQRNARRKHSLPIAAGDQKETNE